MDEETDGDIVMRIRSLYDDLLLAQMDDANGNASTASVDEETIFVALVATARGSAARAADTIVDAFVRALHPRRVFFGVYLSDVSGNLRAECLQRASTDAATDADAAARDCVLHNVRVIREASRNEWDPAWRGVSNARAALEQRAYRGETYYLLTSHATTFVNGWDALHIGKLHACGDGVGNNSNVILTGAVNVAPSMSSRTLVPTRPSLLPAEAALFQVCSRMQRPIGGTGGGVGSVVVTNAADAPRDRQRRRETLATLMRAAPQLLGGDGGGGGGDAVRVIDRDLGTRLGDVLLLSTRPNFVRVYAVTRAAPTDAEHARFRAAALEPFVADAMAQAAASPLPSHTVSSGGAACRLAVLNHLLSLQAVPSVCRYQPRRPTRSAWWSAGYAFARGAVLRDVLHDPFYVGLPQSLYECLMTARYTAAGWTLYTPDDVCLYQTAPYVAGLLAPSPRAAPTRWQAEMASKSVDRLLTVLGIQAQPLYTDTSTLLDTTYGIRDVRRLRAFLAALGLSLNDGGDDDIVVPERQQQQQQQQQHGGLLQRLLAIVPAATSASRGDAIVRGASSSLAPTLCNAACNDALNIRQTSRALYSGVLAERDVLAKYGTMAAYEQELRSYPLEPQAASASSSSSL